MKIKNKLIILFFMLSLSFTAAQAEDMTLEQANEEIKRLTSENESLKTRLKYFEDEIAAHREKLEAYDNPEAVEEGEE